MKVNIHNNYFINHILFTNFYTTLLTGEPVYKKRLHLDVRVGSQKHFFSPKVCEMHYQNYCDNNTSNHFFHGVINIESYIQTNYYNVKFKVSMLVLWDAIFSYTSEKFSTY